jgi:hypothetical protein
MTSRIAYVATVGVATVTAVGVGPPSAAAAATCARPHGARTIVGTASSRAWLVRRKHHLAPSTVAYYGCEAGHAPIRLEKGDESADAGIRIPAMALAGDLIAYGIERKGGLGSSTATVKVRNLSSGATPFHRHAVTTVDNLETFGRVVLAPTGAVGWIAANVADPDFTYEVWKADAAGVAQIDQGPRIVPKSLALQPGTLTWTNGGMPKSVPLLGA